MTPTLVLVLGMHRSGTSASARALGLLGAQMPVHLLPVWPDNPGGYWEPRTIVEFHDRLMAQSALSWTHLDPLGGDWFADPARLVAASQAQQLLVGEYPQLSLAVLKDPRMCRLLPLWLPVLASSSWRPHALLVLRDPMAVASSLAARALAPLTRRNAVVAVERALLLWLRYVLDAEHNSRGMPRSGFDYDDLVRDWRGTLRAALATAGIDLPVPGGPCAVDEFITAPVPRAQLDVAGGLSDAVLLLRTVRAHVLAARDALAEAWLDDLRATLDELCTQYGTQLGGWTRSSPTDPTSELILAELVRRHGLGGTG
jgi:hypothetical protein